MNELLHESINNGNSNIHYFLVLALCQELLNICANVL